MACHIGGKSRRPRHGRPQDIFGRASIGDHQPPTKRGDNTHKKHDLRLGAGIMPCLAGQVLNCRCVKILKALTCCEVSGRSLISGAACWAMGTWYTEVRGRKDFTGYIEIRQNERRKRACRSTFGRLLQEPTLGTTIFGLSIGLQT